MDRSQCRVGMQVVFGRKNGEKTLGEVVKINPKKGSQYSRRVIRQPD